MATIAEIILKYRDDFSEKAKRDLLNFEAQHKRTMGTAKDAADVLKDTLGIQLPRELTKLIAHSQLVGPALAGAFNVIAIAGFISAAGQIPELFAKITEAVTGFGEKSKKVYDDFLASNKAAIESAEKLRLKLLEIDEGRQKSLESGLKAAQARAAASQRAAAAARTANPDFLDTAVGVASFGLVDLAGNRANAEADRLQKIADEQAAYVRQLQGEVTINQKEENKERLKDETKLADEFKKLWEETTNTIILFSRRIRPDSGFFGLGNFNANADIRTQVEALDTISRNAATEAAQGTTLRPIPGLGFFSPDAFDPAGAQARAMVANQGRLIKASDEFIRNLNEGLGRTWDVFTQKGISALGRILNVGKMLLDSIGRSLFQAFGTALLSGARIGGTGGGLLGGAANIGASAGAATGLGALLGGGAAGGGLLAGGLGSALGIQTFSGTGLGLTGGGLTGALGLGGGAGLFGLGAATIPVFGGLALAAYGIFKWLHHKTVEAPFTQDPFLVEKSRTIFFFTNMSEAFDRFAGAINRFSTMPAGVLVAEGMPQALGSSNQFRRSMAGTLLDDDL